METKENKKRALLAASMAGLLAMTAAVIAPTAAHAEDAVPCYGVNACKGTGDCGGKGHGCAGKNTCKGEGYVNLQKDTCLRIQNGSLTAPQA